MAQDKDQKTPNVPPLRFPGFTDGWKATKLKTYLVENKERNTKGKFSKEQVLSVSGDKGVVNQIELLGRSYAGQSVLPYHVVHHSDIVYTKSPLSDFPYGIVKMNRGVDGIVSTLYAVYSVLENAHPSFIEYYFASKHRTNRYFKPIVRIGAKHDMKIGNSEVLANDVTFPDIDEQIRISKFLELIDERIATQNKIIDNLQSLIKGLIHRLSGEGLANDTWHKVMLSDILTERSELNREYYPVHSVSVTAGVVNQVEYLGRSFAAKDTAHYHVVRYGDMVYTKSPTGNQPYGIVKQSHCPNPAAVSPLYGVYEPISFEVGNILHYYFLNPLNTNNYLSPLIQKGAKNTINISNQRFLENRVPLPLDKDEILSVSRMLTAIHAKVTLENNTLITLIKQKQYLLNMLFI